MTRTALAFIFWSIVLILLQAVVFNHIFIFDVAMPFVFIYVILRLPVNMSRNWVLTVAFFMGLAVDILSDTQGMNSLASTILAGVRLPVLRLYFPREEDFTYPQPCIRSLGFGVYLKYALTMSLIYCGVIFIIEAFTFFDLVRLGLCILCSTLLTTLMMVCIDSLTLRLDAKRL
ncbi:MAG: rod shape-determining protein MreD [Clostridium sp.]|nr:rod shape-determining protein MreD [Clostridium sp.]